MASEQVPQVITSGLAGEPTSGTFDVVTHFITANSEGLPMVCLLSRRQLAFDGDNVSALIRSRRTLSNLAFSSTAVLHVIADNAAWTLHLQLTEIGEPQSDGAVSAHFVLTKVEQERVADALEPARYLVTDLLMEREGPSINER